MLDIKASVILPTYRRFEPLLNTLTDLHAQIYNEFEIIVIDQNEYWPEKYLQNLKSIQSSPRVNWIYQEVPDVVVARNMAVQKSKGEILIFIDDDVKIVDTYFIKKYVDAFKQPSVNIVVGRERDYLASSHPNTHAIIDMDKIKIDDLPYVEGMSPLQQALWFNRDSVNPVKVCTFSTCNGAIRRSTFLEVKGFDENFSGNSYGDDYDLILRLHKLGFVGIYLPFIWLIHLKSPMGGLRMSDLKNKRINYVKTSSGFWLFLFRHSTKDMFWHLLYHHVLRKTIFLKVNFLKPWRQFFVFPSLIVGFFRGLFLWCRGPFSHLC